VAAVQGRPIPVYGEGSQRREWLYVRDFVRAVGTVLDAGEPGTAYNIGGGFELSNLELARRICELTGAQASLISFVPDRPGHDFRYGLAWDRLAGLGWRPAVPFSDGLALTVSWYRDNLAWVDAVLQEAPT
jgi:dTDP-glucose 4,6-dehydratase